MLTFEKWKELVDVVLWGEICAVSDDLPDWDYWAAFEAGMEPEDAADMVIRLNIPAFDAL